MSDQAYSRPYHFRASWQKQVSRPKGLTAAEVRERTPTDKSLVCPIDNKLFRDAVKTPCCDTRYCEECIQTHLLERDFVCPSCGKKIASLDKLVSDKPMRTKVNDYIDKAVEDSKKEGEEESNPNDGATPANDQVRSHTHRTIQRSDYHKNPHNPSQQDIDFYSDQQPGGDMDMSQIVADSIPQLQAQIAQISVMLQNPLPNPVRQTTEMQYQQLQIQLQHAQTLAAAFAAASNFQQQQAQNGSGVGTYNNNMQAYQGADYRAWTNSFPNQQPVGHDSAYQRLPLNNRRRNLKRERPSDFLEVGSEHEKVARYWE